MTCKNMHNDHKETESNCKEMCPARGASDAQAIRTDNTTAIRFKVPTESDIKQMQGCSDLKETSAIQNNLKEMQNHHKECNISSI